MKMHSALLRRCTIIYCTEPSAVPMINTKFMSMLVLNEWHATVDSIYNRRFFNIHIQVDGIDYFGEGQTIHEANNDTAWSALKGIWTGDHKKQLDENDEYWYDDDDYNTSFISSENLSCGCCCHFCNCCWILANDSYWIVFFFSI